MRSLKMQMDVHDIPNYAPWQGNNKNKMFLSNKTQLIAYDPITPSAPDPTVPSSRHFSITPHRTSPCSRVTQMVWKGMFNHKC